MSRTDTRTGTAARCLVATCTHLALMTVRDRNVPLWIGVLREVLPDCGSGPEALTPLRAAAAALTRAAPGDLRDRAMTRLRLAVHAYHTRAAAHRHDAWRRLTREETRR